MALCSGFNSKSALLRHEVAYVLGQMQNEVAIPTLIQVLIDESEHVMVRHEAAEALGAIGNYDVRPILESYVITLCQKLLNHVKLLLIYSTGVSQKNIKK